MKQFSHKLLSKLPGYNLINSDQDFFSFIYKNKSTISPQDEIFLLVDEKDEIRRDANGLPLIAPRKKCHHKGSKNYIHRASDFIVVDSTGNILLSKRSNDKDSYPGFLETGGGHCGLESYEDTLTKEINEELGLKKDDIAVIKKFIKNMVKMPEQWQYNLLFEVVVNPGTIIKHDNKEVKGHKRYSPQTILDGIIKGTLNIIPGQKIYLLYYLYKKGIFKNKPFFDILLKDQEHIMQKSKFRIANLELF